MDDKKPKLYDPKEFALIKEVYGFDGRETKEKLDPIEDLDRMYSREKNNKNQAR